MSGSNLSLQQIITEVQPAAGPFFAAGGDILCGDRRFALFDVVLMVILHKKCQAAGGWGGAGIHFLRRQTVGAVLGRIFCREEAVYHFPRSFLALEYTFQAVFWHPTPTPDSSCNSLSTHTPLSAPSEQGHRGRLNKIVELSTPTPSRTL